MDRLLETMRTLRGPDGCPWDREQTPLSLRRYLLEEAAEAVDAISSGDTDEVVGELGDVLLQVAFHAVIGEEERRFSYQDIETAIVDKLIRRHPHVFGDVTVANADEVVRNWQAIKASERKGAASFVTDSIPSGLGALAREAAVQKLRSRPTVCRAEVEALVSTLPETEEGFGELLASVVAWARARGIDPEVALRAHTARERS